MLKIILTPIDFTINAEYAVKQAIEPYLIYTCILSRMLVNTLIMINELLFLKIRIKRKSLLFCY